MSAASKYWTFVRLTLNGQTAIREIKQARTFFQKQFSHLDSDEVLEAQVQPRLAALYQDPNPAASEQARLAEWCLRCFISHQISLSCKQIVTQFGEYYGFSLNDLLPLVLNDDFPDRKSSLSSQDFSGSLARKILGKFNPAASWLSTWTRRLVKHDRNLFDFLLEHGLCLLTDWSLLNGMSRDRLKPILTQFYRLSDSETAIACTLLDSYHAIYRAERRQHKQKGKCLTPTEEQLKRISNELKVSAQTTLTEVEVLTQLETLAEQIRQHQIYCRSSSASSQVSHVDDLGTQPELSTEDDPDHKERLEFLAAYEQKFEAVLNQAIEEVVQDRIRKVKEIDQFLTALQLFHCQRLSMSEIAPQVGLDAQYRVSRLLKLKAFRADVRIKVLDHLKPFVQEIAQAYVDPDRLQTLDDEIETALSAEIDVILQHEAEQSQAPKQHQKASTFAERLCRYLDTLLNP